MMGVGPSAMLDGMEEGMLTCNERRVLPATRDSVTHKFAIAGHEGYLTIGLFDDGLPGEIFIKISKEGSTLSGLVQGFCRAFSLALQYGLSVEDAVDRYRGMSFDPRGSTSNPDIPRASSVLDYVARYLELHFLKQSPMRSGRSNRPRSVR
jgi:ribonucleoside-diphosphate reductase alpha chain